MAALLCKGSTGQQVSQSEICIRRVVGLECWPQWPQTLALALEELLEAFARIR
jgi:hypothetical protein